MKSLLLAALLAFPALCFAGEDPLQPEDFMLERAGDKLTELIADSEKIGTAAFGYYDFRGETFGWGARTTFSLSGGNRAHVDLFSPDWDRQNSEDTQMFLWFEHDFGWLEGSALDPFITIGVGGNLAAEEFGGGVGVGIRWKPDPTGNWHLGAQCAALNLGGDPAIMVGIGAGISL